MSRKLSFVLMAVALIAMVGGCSKNPVKESSTGSDALAQQFDGLTATSESPAFGDASIAASATGEQSYSDQAATNPTCDTLTRDSVASLFHFRAVWGHLRYDSTVTTATDWTGSLTLSRGVEILRNTIRFERGTDSILPRTELNKIEWVSQTMGASDGISVDLFIPRATAKYDTTRTPDVDSAGDTTWVITVDTIPLDPVTLEFKTGPYSRTFSLTELAKLDTIVYLDDSSAVAFDAAQIIRYACPRGFLGGTWGYDSTGQGVFGGAWLSGRGAVAGYFKGHFQTDSTGTNVFYGKWIDLTGQFEGLMKGTWGPHPNEHASDRARLRAGGWFAGEIYNANATVIGIVKGRFKSCEQSQMGFLTGRWKITCATDSVATSNSNDGMEDSPYSR